MCHKIFFSVSFFALVFMALGAHSLAQARDVPVASQQSAEIETRYKLGSGDKIRVTVFGEDDLSGEFEVDGSGTVAFPLIGNIKAGGNDVRDIERLVETKLSDGYLISPRVSIEVMNFRPFFILGEVNAPGSYPYVNGLTVINAVALAGGYTHRARTDRVLIKRGKSNERDEFEAEDETPVFPGDSIRVTERFF